MRQLAPIVELFLNKRCKSKYTDFKTISTKYHSTSFLFQERDRSSAATVVKDSRPSVM